MVEKTKKRIGHARPQRKAKEKPVLHPEFGRILDEWMLRSGATNAEVARELGFKHGEMVARYRRGEAMPKSRKRMQILADLIGISPAELRGETSPQILQSMVRPAERDLTEDEHRLLKAYKKMLPIGQKAIRAHAGRLLEQQGVPDRDNPFGKGGSDPKTN